MNSSLSSGELLVDIRNHIAHLTLNRPQALNSLTHGMVQAMTQLLADWAKDDNVKAIVVRGAGEKAFCAGGDIRTLYDTALRRDQSEQQFFREEYELDFNIHRYLIRTGKPYVAWMDGIVMGGGMGIAMGGVLRIVGGRTRMAMPETAIGLFPDVGGSYFLSRCPGALGTYLGLTGQTIKAADALYAGLATHHIATDAAPDFDRALDSIDWSPGPIAALRDAVRQFAGAPPDTGVLPGLREAIERHFGGKASVAAIIASLQTEHVQPAWAADTLSSLAKKSPTLLEVTRQQIERAATLNLAECFRMELGMVAAAFAHGDILEGIRALMIDKDQAPKWNPQTLAAVTAEHVNEFFRSRWDNDSHPLKDLQIGVRL
jgi:enoyl-CoA hydratase/carnithine racemase